MASSSPKSGVSRRRAVATVAAVAVPAAAQDSAKNPQHKHEGMVNIKPAPASYKPKFFTSDELETVKVVADLIIPRTDTPGAADAGCHRIIDGAARPRDRKAWSEGLAWLNAQTKPAAFTAAPQAKQIEILTRASKETNTPGGRFFRLIKGATVDAYYSTKEGLVTELGWEGNTFLPEFKGCNHPEHQG